MGEVLATSKDLTNQLTDMIKRKNTKLPLAASLVTHEEYYVEDDDPSVEQGQDTTNKNRRNHKWDDIHGLIKLVVSVEGRHTTAVIDTGAQMNLVSKDISDNVICWPVQASLGTTMRDASGGISKLLGHIENVPLQCKGITIYATIYVGEKYPFGLLLGRPWLKENKVSILECDDGRTWLKVGNIGKFPVESHEWMKDNVGNQSINITLEERDSESREFDVAMVTVGNVSEGSKKGGEARNKVSELAAVESELSESEKPKKA